MACRFYWQTLFIMCHNETIFEYGYYNIITVSDCNTWIRQESDKMNSVEFQIED